MDDKTQMWCALGTLIAILIAAALFLFAEMRYGITDRFSDMLIERGADAFAPAQ